MFFEGSISGVEVVVAVLFVCVFVASVLVCMKKKRQAETPPPNGAAETPKDMFAELFDRPDNSKAGAIPDNKNTTPVQRPKQHRHMPKVSNAPKDADVLRRKSHAFDTAVGSEDTKHIIGKHRSLQEEAKSHDFSSVMSHLRSTHGHTEHRSQSPTSFLSIQQRKPSLSTPAFGTNPSSMHEPSLLPVAEHHHGKKHGHNKSHEKVSKNHDKASHINEKVSHSHHAKASHIQSKNVIPDKNTPSKYLSAHLNPTVGGKSHPTGKSHSSIGIPEGERSFVSTASREIVNKFSKPSEHVVDGSPKVKRSVSPSTKPTYQETPSYHFKSRDMVNKFSSITSESKNALDPEYKSTLGPEFPSMGGSENNKHSSHVRSAHSKSREVVDKLSSVVGSDAKAHTSHRKETKNDGSSSVNPPAEKGSPHKRAKHGDHKGHKHGH